MMREYYNRLLCHLEVKDWLIKNGRYNGETKDKIDERIIECKREYRKALKQHNRTKYLYPDKNGDGYGEIVNSGGEWDTFWRKVFFLGEHWSEEEIEEFRKENWKRVRYPAYDCTGDVFTWAVDVFNVPSGVVAYIREAIDC